MEIAAGVGLVFFVLFIGAGLAIRLLITRQLPQPSNRLRLRGTILLIGLLVAVALLVERWLQSIPWLPTRP